MKRAYRFVAGNSLVTPIGTAVAVLVAWFAHGAQWAPFALVAIVVVTLAVSVYERVN